MGERSGNGEAQVRLNLAAPAPNRRPLLSHLKAAAAAAAEDGAS